MTASVRVESRSSKELRRVHSLKKVKVYRTAKNDTFYRFRWHQSIITQLILNNSGMESQKKTDGFISLDTDLSCIKFGLCKNPSVLKGVHPIILLSNIFSQFSFDYEMYKKSAAVLIF